MFEFAKNEKAVLEKYKITLPTQDILKIADNVIDSFHNDHTGLSAQEANLLSDNQRVHGFSALKTFAKSPDLIEQWVKDHEDIATKEVEDILSDDANDPKAQIIREKREYMVMSEAIKISRSIQVAAEAKKRQNNLDIGKKADDRIDTVAPISEMHQRISARFGANVKIHDGRGNRPHH